MGGVPPICLFKELDCRFVLLGTWVARIVDRQLDLEVDYNAYCCACDSCVFMQ